jgi:uncharacterized membrane protein
MLAEAVNLFTPLWLMWGAVFLVIEGTAIWAKVTKRTHSNSTLSSLVWRFQKKWWRKAILIVGWVVLTSHFFFQIP